MKKKCVECKYCDYWSYQYMVSEDMYVYSCRNKKKTKKLEKKMDYSDYDKCFEINKKDNCKHFEINKNKLKLNDYNKKKKVFDDVFKPVPCEPTFFDKIIDKIKEIFFKKE